MADQTITCPNCGRSIPVSKALASEIEKQLREDFEKETRSREEEAQAAYEKRLATETARLEKQAKAEASKAAERQLATMQKQLQDSQKRERASEASFDLRVAGERARLVKEVRKAAEQETSAEIDSLRRDLREKDREVAAVQRERADLRKKQDQLSARQEAMENEVARAVEKATRKATDEVESEYRTHQLELEKKLADATRQAADLKRKLEQGSQQTQGEVIERELTKLLAKAFPDDVVQAVGKGRSGGADVIQKVYSSTRHYCGSIIWESKNTRTWVAGWLSKLRGDQRRAQADLAVLVSMVLPKGVSHFSHVDGVWVTDFNVAVGLATALRANLIQVAGLKQSSEGKTERLQVLHDYLASTPFRQRIEAIVEAFRSMEEELAKEKLAAEKRWSQRHIQLQSVFQNVSGMYGDMQDIMGRSLPKIRRLELSAGEES